MSPALLFLLRIGWTTQGFCVYMSSSTILLFYEERHWDLDRALNLRTVSGNIVI